MILNNLKHFSRHSEPTGEESHVSLVRDISLTLNMTELYMLRNSMTKIVLWIASKSKIFRNDGFNLHILQLIYSYTKKEWLLNHSFFCFK